ncbi:hypothetical protein GA0061071_107188 [Kosakonia oryzendophytica]|uniref:DUF3592 domain-containing protein n=2 Tax=Kosakonia oryzendophytica TaxID=1005665 RepID=A0A1C4CFE4_9ENTR|nr:hypothetical protein DFO53_0850 [Enterobacter sp. AG5470]SCC17809.1 hypothetical protein GA0061071_107188 [Kosakonia oryzendophytica]
METIMLSISIFFVSFFLLGFITLIVVMLRNDANKEKVKKEIREHGILTLATIKRVFSRSGGNSGYINATLELVFETEDGSKIACKADTVIDALSIQKYQAGEQIPLRYLPADPHKNMLDVPSTFELMKRH